MQWLVKPTPLPGLSNRNLRVDTPTDVYVLRLARPDGSGYVDRAHELAVTAAMSELGIGAPFVAGDAAGGWLITRFVAGAEPLTGERLNSDVAALASVVAGFRRLQRAPVRFDRVFDPFDTIEDYRQKLARAPHALPLDPALLDALPIAAAWVAAEPPALASMAHPHDAAAPTLDRQPLPAAPPATIADPVLREVVADLLAEQADARAPDPLASADAPRAADPTSGSRSGLVPAHGDPTPANMLFDGVAVTLIDWEYAAMAHPLWDFAGLAVEAALPTDAELAMLAMAGVRPTRGYVGLKFAALMVSGLWAALRDDSARPDPAIRRLRDERLSLAAVLADNILAA